MTFLEGKSWTTGKVVFPSNIYEILSKRLNSYHGVSMVRIWVLSPRSSALTHFAAAQSSNIYEKLAGLTISGILLL